MPVTTSPPARSTIPVANSFGGGRATARSRRSKGTGDFGADLGTKLAVPALPPTWTERPRLDRLLTSAVDRRCAAVTGPPGSGKSAALAGWTARHPDRAVAWVSVDVRDNEHDRLWRAVMSALDRCDRGRGDDTGRRADRGGSATASLLIERMQAMPAFVLVLDDFHVLSDPGVVGDFEWLVDNLPQHGHVVVSGRADPRLPLHRLRARGELAEVREHDLCFDDEEAAVLLTNLADRPLDPRHVRALVEHTEGWTVGLQLAGLTLRAEDDVADFVRRFTGNARVVAEYLLEEVLGALPQELQRFLLLTSVLDGMTVKLCEAATGSRDAGQIIDELESRHLFVSRVDGSEAFRYHRLLAEFLRHTLHVRDPEGMRSAHRRVAERYLGDGDVVSACEHLVAGGEFERALRAMGTDVVAELDGGADGDLPVAVASGVPLPFVLDDPVRIFELAAASLVVGGAVEGELWLQRLQSRTADLPSNHWLLARAELLWALHAGLLGDAEGALDHVARLRRPPGDAGALRPGDAGASPPPPPAVRAAHPWIAHLDRSAPAIAAALASRAHGWLGRFEAARDELRADFKGSLAVTAVVFPGLAALAAVGLGRLSDGYGLAAKSLEMAARLGKDEAPIAVDAHLAMGRVLCERAEFDDAASHLEVAAALCRRRRQLARAAEVELDLARLLLGQRRFAAAASIMSRLQDQAAVGALPAFVQRCLAVTDVEWRAATGDLEGARDGLDRLPEIDRSSCLEARVDLCAGRPDLAQHRLADAPRPRSTGEELELLVLRAQGLVLTGLQQRARSTLSLALQKARPERHARVFVEAGADIWWLLATLTTRFPDPYLDGILERARRTGPTSEPGGWLVTPVDGLTVREREVLARLATHLTQREIADDLFVSLNTLKTHLKGLYRKLGAASRAEAVTAARAHGFI